MRLADYWARDYAGPPFRLFGAAHLTALAVVAGLNLAWPALGPGLTTEARQGVRLVMAGALLVNEAVFHLWNWRTGQWTLRTMLPLHLCSVLVYASAWMLITRHYTAYELCYFMGLGGATQALLTPDAGRYGFPHLRFWTTMISHGLIVSAPLYMTLVEGYAPTANSLLVVAGLMLAYTAVVAVVNWRLGSNYLYIAHVPETPSLIDHLGPWPRYIVWLMLIALAMMVVLYLPFVGVRG